MARLLASLGEIGEPDTSLDRLCATCVTELGMSGASVALILTGHDPGTIASSDESASLLVDLQFGLGEGPSIDAFGTRRAVLEPELGMTNRWPAFVPEAIAAGAAAVFSLPLQIGAARFGALTLHRNRPGPLGSGVLADVLAIAEVASEITLRLQAKMPAGSLHQVVEDLLAQRTVVYQATGMILVQLDVSPEKALVALKARAYADGRPVGEVAADVVARRLRLEN